MKKIKSASVSQLFFVPWSNSACNYRGSPCSRACKEQSWGQGWLCVGTGAVGAEDSGWEVELPHMLFPSVHLLRHGEEGEREKRKKNIAHHQHTRNCLGQFFVGILVQSYSC